MISKENIEKIVRSRMPILVKNQKGKIRYPFRSNHIQEEVIKHLSNGIYEELTKFIDCEPTF